MDALQVLNNISITQYLEEYFEMNRSEELKHRGKSYDRVKTELTVPQAAKLFCVKQIARSLLKQFEPQADAYLFLRPSLFYAHSLVANYRAEIEKVLADFDLQELAALDYAELMKP